MFDMILSFGEDALLSEKVQLEYFTANNAPKLLQSYLSIAIQSLLPKNGSMYQVIYNALER